MPYNYRIKVEYTDQKGARKQTFEVDGSHKFVLADAKAAEHQEVDVECTGPITEGPLSHILFKLRP